MEHDQRADLGVGREPAHVADQRMTPAVLVRHVGVGVLRVVDQHVDAVQVLDPLIEGRRRRAGRIEFVVGDVGDRHAAVVDAVGDAAARMVQRALDDAHAGALVEFAFDALELADVVRRQVLGVHREGHAVHLLEQRTQQLAPRRNADVDVDVAVGLVDRIEERVTHDVIPVAVRHQDIGRVALFRELLAEQADAGAGIEYEVVAVVELDVHARRVAAVLDRLRSRCRGRAAHAVKGDHHSVDFAVPASPISLFCRFLSGLTIASPSNMTITELQTHGECVSANRRMPQSTPEMVMT